MGVSNKDFQWYQEQVLDYLSDQLSVQDRQRFDGLTESSPKCREFLTHAKRTWSLLRRAHSARADQFSGADQLGGESETSTLMYGGKAKSDRQTDARSDQPSDRKASDQVDPPRKLTQETPQEESS